MVGQRGFFTAAKPMRPKAVQPGAPFAAAFDFDLAAQTQSLAFRERVSAHSYFWPYATVAPKFDGSTVNSDAILTSGASGFAEMEIPWVAHPNAGFLLAYATVALNSFDLEFRLSMETKTLLSAVSTTQSDPKTVAPAMPMPRLGRWGRKDSSGAVWKLGYVAIWMEPDYPADRKLPFAIRFKGQWYAENNPTNISVVRKAALVSLRLQEIVVNPDPES